MLLKEFGKRFYLGDCYASIFYSILGHYKLFFRWVTLIFPPKYQLKYRPPLTAFELARPTPSALMAWPRCSSIFIYRTQSQNAPASVCGDFECRLVRTSAIY